MQALAGKVKVELLSHVRCRELLLAELPGLDETTRADTLEGATNLQELLAELVRSALEDEALSTGLSTRLTDMKARIERLNLRAERKRALAVAAMTEADIKSLLEPDFTASLRRAPPRLDVIAEDRIPPAYWKPQPPKLDRQSILAALKEGSNVDGAVLAAPQVQLSVRTK